MNENKAGNPHMWVKWEKAGAIGVIESKKTLKSGEMPHTDFRYEEFEGFLASYHLSLSTLATGGEQDKKDFQAIVEAINGIAERNGLQMPEVAATQPREPLEDWARPKAFSSAFMLIDSSRAFYSDFGVGMESGTPDSDDRLKLGRTIYGLLDRYGVIKARFGEKDGEKIIIGIESKNRDLMFKPLQEVLRVTV
jgi:hypothetical protein